MREIERLRERGGTERVSEGGERACVKERNKLFLIF